MFTVTSFPHILTLKAFDCFFIIYDIVVFSCEIKNFLQQKKKKAS